MCASVRNHELASQPPHVCIKNDSTRAAPYSESGMAKGKRHEASVSEKLRPVLAAAAW